MKIYAVGGAVRDRLLGREVADQDYVVVGATPQQMEQLGYRPVGKDFPVFLHPQTHEEYALARTERKTARGYKGFDIYAAPEVTLEQDLARRDLTINAIARDLQGNIIDPFHGAADLKAGILRHVSPAFVEDPVRVLRVARFAARFGFTVAPTTLELMREMVRNGEVDHLVAERAWQEISRGLMEAAPSRMFLTLRDCAALARVLPEVDALFGVPQPPEHHPEVDTGIHITLVVDYAAGRNFPLPVRFAALTHDLGKGVTPKALWPKHHGHEHKSVELVEKLCQRLRAPNECRDLAVLVARYHCDVHRAEELRPGTILKLLSATDVFRKPERFEEFVDACACDFHGRTGYEQRTYPPADILRCAAAAARAVDAGAIALEVGEPSRIPGAIEAVRLKAVTEALAAARQR
ncbi:MAG TPA: multifunctional CCA addition/repair protein [Burkholderiales bacterium]|jgi:tRNA nucleotidyltransferase (CCA-adding enzyme)|nr:multifunctional CCA addition/repair protein [Burkholderiales bacterium]